MLSALNSRKWCPPLQLGSPIGLCPVFCCSLFTGNKQYLLPSLHRFFFLLCSVASSLHSANKLLLMPIMTRKYSPQKPMCYPLKSWKQQPAAALGELYPYLKAGKQI